MTARLFDFLKALAVGLALALGVFLLGMFRSFGVLRSVCDGFFVSSVMMLGVGGLKAMRNKGIFDVAEFGIRTIVDVTIPALQRKEKEDLIQFRERKATERKAADAVLLAGAVLLAMCFLSYGIYLMSPENLL